MSVWTKGYEFLTDTVNMFTNPITQTRFLEEGVITPDEVLNIK